MADACDRVELRHVVCRGDNVVLPAQASALTRPESPPVRSQRPAGRYLEQLIGIKREHEIGAETGERPRASSVVRSPCWNGDSSRITVSESKPSCCKARRMVGVLSVDRMIKRTTR